MVQKVLNILLATNIVLKLNHCVKNFQIWVNIYELNILMKGSIWLNDLSLLKMENCWKHK